MIVICYRSGPYGLVNALQRPDRRLVAFVRAHAHPIEGELIFFPHQQNAGIFYAPNGNQESGSGRYLYGIIGRIITYERQPELIISITALVSLIDGADSCAFSLFATSGGSTLKVPPSSPVLLPGSSNDRRLRHQHHHASPGSAPALRAAQLLADSSRRRPGRHQPLKACAESFQRLLRRYARPTLTPALSQRRRRHQRRQLPCAVLRYCASPSLKPGSAGEAICPFS